MPTRLHLLGVWILVILTAAIAASPALGGVRAPDPLHLTNRAAARADAGPAPTDTELDHFAHAIIATGNIKRAARPGIVNAPTPADRAKLDHATANAIKAAIRSNHLSVQRYLQIITFVQGHPATQMKVVALLKLLMPPLPSQQPLNP
ncbi:MAG: DUF4168 domain-containing protein [Rhodanobacteraceae bacterium]